MRRTSLLALLLSSALLPACLHDDPGTEPPPEPGATSPLSEGRDLVAVPRAVEASVAQVRRKRLAEAGAPVRRQSSGDDFVLAIRKSALAERWFLTAFLEQYFPDAVLGEDASSLGTRVVSFKVQNGKLFVFDVDGRGGESEVLQTARIVEAYPIVEDASLRGLAGARDYVFFDPAAGLNRFDLVTDYLAAKPADSGVEPVKFTTELSFLQGFQRLDDGAFYQQVFTGYADRPLHDGGLETNRFRASGTLGITLRRYREGEGFTPAPMPEVPYFFESEPHAEPFQGEVQHHASRWNIHPGMKPIEWVISPELARVDATPEYADVDLVGIVKGGIEGWNAVFGYPVFTARVARDDESFARDDVNYVVYEPTNRTGYAFASWRTNPITGEIRGASIYLEEIFIRRSRFVDDPAPATARKPVPGLRWSGTVGGPLCALHVDDLPVDRSSRLTAGEKLTHYLGHTIAHEIGHNLGLRHNFKGSLLPPSSSVMDYLDFVDRVAVGAVPQSYDVDAIRYLYGMSDEPPAQPFCTDDDLGEDADCRIRDRGADPLADTFAARWVATRNDFLDGVNGEWAMWLVGQEGRGVLDYARHGSWDQSERALDLLFADIAVPVDPARVAASSTFAVGADLVMRELLSLLRADPAQLQYRVDEQIDRVMRNEDGIRSFATRRTLVPALKARQTLEGLKVLLAARDVVEAELASGSLDPDQAVLGRDLLSTIDAATHPYFTN